MVVQKRRFRFDWDARAECNHSGGAAVRVGVDADTGSLTVVDLTVVTVWVGDVAVVSGCSVKLETEGARGGVLWA